MGRTRRSGSRRRRKRSRSRPNSRRHFPHSPVPLRVKFLLAIASLCLVVATPLLAQGLGDWKDESTSKGVQIQSRKRGTTGVREFRAVGTIGAPPRAVLAVLNDAEAFPSFMPYVSESRLLKRDDDMTVCYQRLSLPLLADRDYTLRTRTKQLSRSNGPAFDLRWVPVNDLGPAPQEGVVRVTVCDGGWLLEPLDHATTRATYTIFTDGGGKLPAFLENKGSQIAIRKLFEAVRKQVREPKYNDG